MNTGTTAQKAVVTQVNMSAEHDVVSEYVFVTDGTIMTYMRANHKEVIMADDGFPILVQAAVNGDIFPNRVFGTDNNTTADLGIEFNRLRVAANDCTGPDHAILANGYITEQLYVGMDPGSAADTNTVFDDCECPDFDIVGDAGVRADDGAFVNVQEYWEICK